MMPRLPQHSYTSIKRPLIVGVDIKELRKTPAACQGQSAVQHVARGEMRGSDAPSIAVGQLNKIISWSLRFGVGPGSHRPIGGQQRKILLTTLKKKNLFCSHRLDTVQQQH